jgi:hypothetical protein
MLQGCKWTWLLLMASNHRMPVGFYEGGGKIYLTDLKYLNNNKFDAEQHHNYNTQYAYTNFRV